MQRFHDWDGTRLTLACFGVLACAGAVRAGAADQPAAVQAAATGPAIGTTDSCTPPPYPGPAGRPHPETSILLRLLLGPDGKVKRAVVATSSGDSALDADAVAAFSRCSFKPPVFEGKPANAWLMFQYIWVAQKALDSQ